MRNSVSAEIIEALRQFDSPTVSNAIEAFKVRNLTEGYVSMEIRCQFPDLKPMVGYAVTCTMDSTTPGPKRKGKLLEFLDLLAAVPKPTIVVAQDIGPDRLRSCFSGDLICSVYQALGAVGLVSTGGIRDMTGIQSHAPGFQVFAPGAVVSHGNVVKLDIDIPVTVGGLEIRPGDLLHGDESGLVKVPLDIAESVVDQARKVRETEARVFQRVSSSMSIDEIKALISGADIAQKKPQR